MIVTKVFAKNDSEFIRNGAAFIEVNFHVGEGSYDEEDSKTWNYVDSIYVIQDKAKIDITWIVKRQFPKFELSLVEDFDWSLETNEL